MLNDVLLRKIYVQLQPVASTLEHIRSIQMELQSNTSFSYVKPAAIHLTIIHIGRIDRILKSMEGATTKKLPELLHNIEKLTQNLLQVTNYAKDSVFALEPVGYERLGINNQTFTLLFEPSLEITHLHIISLDVLQSFFADCGIHDVDDFMNNDLNFRHALSLHPHISIAKRYEGPAPKSIFLPAECVLIPIAYDP